MTAHEKQLSKTKEETAATIARVEQLKGEFIHILTELDAIAPVQFVDIDCDETVRNFRTVSYSPEENKVYVELTMWTDSLPAHKNHPLKDGHGREIPYEEV